jgi:hypothetical protein
MLWFVMGILVLLGLAAGLALTWGMWPVQYYDTDPLDLRAELKQDYLLLTSSSYAWNEDLGRAQRRLSWLGLSEEEAARSLTALVHRYSKSGDAATVRGLSKLAYALGARDNQVLVFIVTPTPTVTLTPGPTSTVMATPILPRSTPNPTPRVAQQGLATSTATAAATSTPDATGSLVATPGETTEALRFQLGSKRFRCRAVEGLPPGEGLLQVRVRDRAGTPVPGTALTVQWGGGEDQFFTGLKPDKGLDYADFEMQPGREYSLTAEHQSQPVNISFRDKDCITDVVTGSVPVWEVVFERNVPRVIKR